MTTNIDQCMPRASEMTGPMISATTAGRIPLKAASTTGLWRTSAKKSAMASRMTNDGSTTPSSAAAAPRSPRTLYPTKTEVLSEIGPGTDWASVSRSRNSLRSTHCRLSITSRSISGIIA